MKKSKEGEIPLAHADGQLLPTVDFEWSVVEKNLFGDVDLDEMAELTPEDLERVWKVCDCLLRWVWQNGMKNVDGLQIRTIILCWVFIKELRPMEMSELARGFGKDKQSIGRWFDVFKVDFPFIRTPHMR